MRGFSSRTTISGNDRTIVPNVCVPPSQCACKLNRFFIFHAYTHRARWAAQSSVKVRDKHQNYGYGAVASKSFGRTETAGDGVRGGSPFDG